MDRGRRGAAATPGAGAPRVGPPQNGDQVRILRQVSRAGL